MKIPAWQLAMEALMAYGVPCVVGTWHKRLPRAIAYGVTAKKNLYPREWEGQDLWYAAIGEGGERFFGRTAQEAWDDAEADLVLRGAAPWQQETPA